MGIQNATQNINQHIDNGNTLVKKKYFGRKINLKHGKKPFFLVKHIHKQLPVCYVCYMYGVWDRLAKFQMH